MSVQLAFMHFQVQTNAKHALNNARNVYQKLIAHHVQ